MSHRMTRDDYSHIGFDCVTMRVCDRCRMGSIPVWEKSGEFVAERIRTGKWFATTDLCEWGHAYTGMVAHVTHVVEDGYVIIGWAFAHGDVGSIVEEFYRVPGNETYNSKVFNIPQEAKCETPYTDFVREQIQPIPEDDSNDDGSDEHEHENFECPCLQEEAAARAQQVSSQHADDSDDDDY